MTVNGFVLGDCCLKERTVDCGKLIEDHLFTDLNVVQLITGFHSKPSLEREIYGWNILSMVCTSVIADHITIIINEWMANMFNVGCVRGNGFATCPPFTFDSFGRRRSHREMVEGNERGYSRIPCNYGACRREEGIITHFRVSNLLGRAEEKGRNRGGHVRLL